MPTYDTVTQVRIVSCPELPREHRWLLQLIEEENTGAAIYLQLSRLLGGEAGVRLRQMSEQDLAHSACLKGIYTLITGVRPPAPGAAVQVESASRMLRRCYGREMRCLAQYEKRSSDPEYGPVFAKLARQEQGHCRMLLEIIETGELQKEAL